MTLVERQLVRRFAYLAARIVLALAWLGVLLNLPVLLDDDHWNDATIWRVIFRSVAFMELAIAIGAPLAMVLVILDAKRSGLLFVLMGAGLSPARVRRVLLVTAGITWLASAIALEATGRASAIYARLQHGADAIIVRSDDRHVWLPAGSGGPAFVFGADDFEVATAQRGVLDQEAEAVLLEGWRATNEPRVRSKSLPVRLTRLVEPTDRTVSSLLDDPSLAAFAIVLNRSALGMVLLLGLAYLALLLPVAVQVAGLIAMLGLVPVAGIAVMWQTTLLFARPEVAVWIEIAWVGVLCLVLCLMDFAFHRRGLRLA